MKAPRPRRLLFYAVLTLITVLSLIPLDSASISHIHDKIEHALVYLLLAFLAARAFPHKKFLADFFQAAFFVSHSQLFLPHIDLVQKVRP